MKSNRNALRPILFNTEMVQAIMDGRKTMTRRIVKMNWEITEPGKFELLDDGSFQFHFDNYPSIYDYPIYPPVYEGDILYVRETWKTVEAGYPPLHSTIVYRAGGEAKFDKIIALPTQKGEWKPSIFMPKEAARLFLRVKDVTVERLRDMVLADVLMEGIKEEQTYESTWEKWHRLWDSTISKKDLPKYGWKANPWVYVIRFDRMNLSTFEEAEKVL